MAAICYRSTGVKVNGNMAIMDASVGAWKAAIERDATWLGRAP